MYRLGHNVAVEGHVVHVVLSDHVLHQLVMWFRLEGFLKAGHRRGVQCARVGLCGHNSILHVRFLPVVVV